MTPDPPDSFRQRKAPRTPPETNDSSPYQIREERRQNEKLPLHSSLGIVVHFALFLGWAWYLYTRLRACVVLRSTEAATYWHEWLIVWCEVLHACPEVLQIIEITATFAAFRQPSRPILSLCDDRAPLIHVLVTVCGEDLDVIMDTVAAAATQDYPKDCYRVFVLDDARDNNLQQAVNDFNITSMRADQYPVKYLAREKNPRVPHYYKSGNLHFGLKVTKDVYGGSEFFAALDADMIPEVDWLSKTVPHLLRSPNLALASPPQLSYNIPDGDDLGQDSNVFGKIMEPIRDSFGCSQCSGSGYVMRREALDSIGGWPLTNVGEDIVCSYMLEAAGWKAAFLEDELQFGMAPGSLHAYAVQRVRWTAGSLLIARKFRFFLPFLNGSPLSVAQRLFGMHHAFKTYFSAALAMPMILLPVLLVLPATSEVGNEIARRQSRRSYLFLWLMGKIWKHLAFGKVGKKNLSNISRNRYWVVPYHVYALVQSFAVDLEDTPFTVSGTIKSPVDERSAQNRQPLVQRMCNPLVLMHTIYWLVAASALLAGANLVFGTMDKTSTSCSHTGAMLRLLEVVVATSTPVRYMLFPPTVLPRRDYLEKDEKTGVYRSRRKTWIKRDAALVSWKEIVEAVVMLVCDWL